MTDADVLIIGAGVAGCSLARLLDDRGLDVILLEKGDVGGLLREIEFDTGYYCDSAPHLLFFDEEDQPEVRDLFEQYSSLRGNDFYAATYPRGDLNDPHHYPVSEANIDRWDDAAQIRAELRETTDAVGAEFFDEFVISQVGETLYERYYRHYTEKHWGVDPSRITGDWFDFKINFPEKEREFFGDGAYYPEDCYTDILAEMIAGCELQHDRAARLVIDGGRVDSVVTDDGMELSADVFVSTIDPSALLPEAVESPRYRSMVILGAHIQAEADLFPQHVDWGYFPNHYEFTRITDYEFTRQSLTSDEYILTVEFPCFEGDRLWRRPDEWYQSYLVDFLEEQDLAPEILSWEVRRAPRAYPLPLQKEIEKFRRLDAELTAYENLETHGRVGNYEYIWMKDIVEASTEMAPRIERLLRTSD